MNRRSTPLTRLKLHALIDQVHRGVIAHEEAQRQVAYACWQRRTYENGPGDALTDWAEAEVMLGKRRVAREKVKA